MMKKLLPLVLVATLTGCADEAAAPPGQLELALVAPGPGGSSYRLLPGSQLAVRNESFFETFSLDGDSATILIDLPVGDYEVTLQSEDGFFSPVFPLIRNDGSGNLTQLSGTLITPMPASVTIQADTTASLVLSFQVAASGVITFAQGSLAVSADVQVVDATSAVYNLRGTVSVTEGTIYPEAPAALAGYWPATGASDIQVSFDGGVGKWEQRSSSRVCAALAMNPPIVSGGPASFADLVSETLTTLYPHPADLCVVSVGDTQLLELQTVRLGAARTATLAGLGPAEYLFVSRFAVALPEPVFDGQILDLGLLDWGHGGLTMTGALEVHEVTEAGEMVPWYQGDLEGIDAVFYFVPTAE